MSFRHREFIVAVSLNGKQHSSGRRRLGLDADWSDGKSLYVKAILSGAIEDWNQMHPGEDAVRPGDRIVAVNGSAGNAQAMVQECRDRLTLQLLVRRDAFASLPPQANEHAQFCRVLPTVETVATAKPTAADFYTVLSLGSCAGETELRRRYRALISQWQLEKHPHLRDKSKYAISQINSAYEVLLNPAKRSSYDHMLASMSRKKTGACLDAGVGEVRAVIPKEFLICPLGHFDKFVRLSGDGTVRVDSRHDNFESSFLDFFDATLCRFSLQWRPDSPNLCVLTAQPFSAQTVETSSNVNFAFSSRSSQDASKLFLSSSHDANHCNFRVTVSPFSSNSFRFEAAACPGRHITFQQLSGDLVIERGDGVRRDSDVIDFTLVEYSMAYQYMTVNEILSGAAEVLCEGSADGYVRLSDLRADLNVRSYFQKSMGGAVWNNRDFETFFYGHRDFWDFDQTKNRVKFRLHLVRKSNAHGDEMALQPAAAAVLFGACDGLDDTIEAILTAKCENWSAVTVGTLVPALRRLAQVSGVFCSSGRPRLVQARQKIIQALFDIAHRAKCSTWQVGCQLLSSKTAVDVHKLTREITEDDAKYEQTLGEQLAGVDSHLAAILSIRVARHPEEVDWHTLADLLAMPLDWTVVATPLRSALSEHLRNAKSGGEPVGNYNHTIRAAASVGRQARGIADELTNWGIQEVRQTEGGSAARLLLAIAENSSSLTEAARCLRPSLLSRFPLQDLVEVLAAFGERGDNSAEFRSALQLRVAVAGPALAAVPPHRLLRLAAAALRSSVIADAAIIGPVLAAAAANLHQWPLSGIPELMMLASTVPGAVETSGARRLFTQAVEVLTPRLVELSSGRLLRAVVAAGAAAMYSKPLLEVAADRATSDLGNFTIDQVFLLTKGSLFLGCSHPAMVRLLEYWDRQFDSATLSGDHSPCSVLSADDVAQLVQLLTLVAPGHVSIFEKMGAQLLVVRDQLSDVGLAAVSDTLDRDSSRAFSKRDELILVVEKAREVAQNRAKSRDKRRKRDDRDHARSREKDKDRKKRNRTSELRVAE